jgi:hypothetical protein
MDIQLFRWVKVLQAQFQPHQLSSKAGVAVSVRLAQGFVEVAAAVEACAAVIVYRALTQNRPHNGDEMRVLVQQSGGRRLHSSTHTLAYVVACGLNVHSWPLSAGTSSEGSPSEKCRAKDEFILGIVLALIYDSQGLGIGIAVFVHMAVETRRVVIDDVDPFEQWAALTSAVGVAHDFEHSCE